MIDLTSCFSDNAIIASDPSCSSYSGSASNLTNTPSTHYAVKLVFTLALSSLTHIFVTVSWSKHQSSHSLSLTFGHNPSTAFTICSPSRYFKKKKGTRAFDSGGFKIQLFWDLSAAIYGVGPEPISGFYLLVVVNSELGLSLGDLAEEATVKKLRSGLLVNNTCLVSRHEHFHDTGLMFRSTTAIFSGGGNAHEILIKCRGEDKGVKYPVLSVYIDRKKVARVKRLQWNFRGSQTVMVEGREVELMWDVHDWFFDGPATAAAGKTTGNAVFMFKTRREVRLGGGADFYLFIHADNKTQTIAFVAFNKVMTAQYFVWFFCLLPLILPWSTMKLKWEAVMCIIIWTGAQAHWLMWAYILEFRGENVFVPLWVASMLFLAANTFVMVMIVLRQSTAYAPCARNST